MSRPSLAFTETGHKIQNRIDCSRFDGRVPKPCAGAPKSKLIIIIFIKNMYFMRSERIGQWNRHCECVCSSKIWCCCHAAWRGVPMWLHGRASENCSLIFWSVSAPSCMSASVDRKPLTILTFHRLMLHTQWQTSLPLLFLPHNHFFISFSFEREFKKKKNELIIAC